MARRVYAWIEWSPPAMMLGETAPPHRAVPRSAGYRTGHKLRVEVDNRSA
jgi:hypothetical protein